MRSPRRSCTPPLTAGKLVHGAVGSAAVADDSLGLTDLAGTDVSGHISVSISAGNCLTLSLGVTGAAVGQVAVFAWTGGSIPGGVMTGPMQVPAPGTVVLPMCNVSSSTVTMSNVPVRVITFD
jgi:hypothetical protein